jgi:hypothetical protein
MIKNNDINIKVCNKNLSYYRSYDENIKSGDIINIGYKKFTKLFRTK